MNDSLKKAVITGLSIAPSLEELSDNQLVLITALGLIIGTPVSLNDKCEDTGTRLMQSVLSKIHEGIQPQGANDGCLLLTDVTIYTSTNHPINIGTTTVFFDQIIGASIGQLRFDN